MKLSISVPDDLWRTVYEDGESASQVVQEALRLLAARRARPFPSSESSNYPYSDEDMRSELLERVDRLAAEARRLHGAAYSIGIDVAGRIPWSSLDQLTDAEELARQLNDWWVNEAALAPVPLLEDSIDEFLSQYEGIREVLFDDAREPVEAPTLWSGVAAGLTEMRRAVRLRLSAELGGGANSQSDTEEDGK